MAIPPAASASRRARFDTLDRRFLAGAAGVLLLFIGIRVSLLVTQPALFYNKFDAYLGAVAYDLRADGDTPLLDLQYNSWNPAPAFLSLLVVPFQKAIGPYHQATNVALFVLHLAVLGAWLFFGTRCFGRRAALLGALVWALGPPAMIAMSMMQKGGYHYLPLAHFAAVAVLLDLGRRLAAAPEGETPARLSSAFLAFGLVNGLASWWASMHAPALAALLIVLALETPLSRWLRGLPPLAAGFAIGYAPAIYYNLTRDFRGYRFEFTSLSAWMEEVGRNVPEQLAEVVLRVMPVSYFSSLPLGGAIVTAAVWSAWAVLLVGVVRDARRKRPDGAPRMRPETFFVVYLPLFLLMLAVLPLYPSSKYLWTEYIYGALLVGLAAAELSRRSRAGRALAAGLVIAATAPGALSYGYLMIQGGFRAAGPLEGVANVRLGAWLGENHAHAPRDAFERVAEYPAWRRAELYEGTAIGLSNRTLRGRQGFASLLEAVSAIPTAEDRRYAYGGVGRALLKRANNDARTADGQISRAVFVTNGAPPEAAEAILRAAARAVEFEEDDPAEACEDLATAEQRVAYDPVAAEALLRRFADRRAKRRFGMSWPMDDLEGAFSRADRRSLAREIPAYLETACDEVPGVRQAKLRELGAALMKAAFLPTSADDAAERWRIVEETAAPEEIEDVVRGMAKGAVEILGDEVRLPAAATAESAARVLAPLAPEQRARFGAYARSFALNEERVKALTPAVQARARRRLAIFHELWEPILGPVDTAPFS